MDLKLNKSGFTSFLCYLLCRELLEMYLSLVDQMFHSETGRVVVLTA